MKGRLTSSPYIVLFIIASGIGIAGFGLVVLSQAVFRPQMNNGAGTAAHGLVVLLVSGAAIVVAFLGTMLLWGQIRSLLRRAKDDQMTYRTVLESCPDAIFLISDVIEQCNQRACDLWGRQPDEMIGRTFAEICCHSQPDGQDSAEEAGAHMAAARTGTPQTFSWRHVRQDGAPVDTEISLKSIEAGRRKILLVVARDVTEQRQVEEQLRERNEFIETILDEMPIGLSVLTFDDRIIRYMNRKAEEIVGWPREVINDHEQFWQAAIPDPDYRAEVVGKLDRDLGRGDPSQMVWEVSLTKHSGETAVNLWTSIPMFEHNLIIITVQDFTAQRRAEEALRRTEMDRIQLQTELNLAAEVQRKLLPSDPPRTPGVQIAAFCLPARLAGGDFYDWQESAPGKVMLAFGDVMGKGMAAAMLMATVRATLRAVTRDNGPAAAVRLAEQALRHDLEGSERFVTLFLAQFDVVSGTLTYLDCGHGYVFLRRRDGTVEELLPRGLPVGISADETYQEGCCVMKEGDALIVYSDGMLEIEIGEEINHRVLSKCVAEATNAREMVELIAALVEPSASLPDDTTILVMRKDGE